MISKLIHGRKGLKVLDIGCGNGHDLMTLAAKHPGNEFYGFDVKFHGQKEEVKGSKIVLSHGEAVGNWPKDFKNFDLIYSSTVLHFIDRKEWNKFFSKVKHHLIHGGKFILIDIMTTNNKVYYTEGELKKAVRRYFYIVNIKEWTQHDLIPVPHVHKMIMLICKKKLL